MDLRIYSPRAVAVRATTETGDVALVRSGDHWIGEVADGAVYGLIATGPEDTRISADRTLVDPLATTVWFPDEHRRDAARPDAGPNHDIAPRAVAVPWPERRPQRWTSRPLVVQEAHVRGMTRRRDRPDAGTYRAR